MDFQDVIWSTTLFKGIPGVGKSVLRTFETTFEVSKTFRSPLLGNSYTEYNFKCYFRNEKHRTQSNIQQSTIVKKSFDEVFFASALHPAENLAVSYSARDHGISGFRVSALASLDKLVQHISKMTGVSLELNRSVPLVFPLLLHSYENGIALSQYDAPALLSIRVEKSSASSTKLMIQQAVAAFPTALIKVFSGSCPCDVQPSHALSALNVNTIRSFARFLQVSGLPQFFPPVTSNINGVQATLPAGRVHHPSFSFSFPPAELMKTRMLFHKLMLKVQTSLQLLTTNMGPKIDELTAAVSSFNLKYKDPSVRSSLMQIAALASLKNDKLASQISTVCSEDDSTFPPLTRNYLTALQQSAAASSKSVAPNNFVYLHMNIQNSFPSEIQIKDLCAQLKAAQQSETPSTIRRHVTQAIVELAGPLYEDLMALRMTPRSDDLAVNADRGFNWGQQYAVMDLKVKQAVNLLMFANEFVNAIPALNRPLVNLLGVTRGVAGLYISNPDLYNLFSRTACLSAASMWNERALKMQELVVKISNDNERILNHSEDITATFSYAGLIDFAGGCNQFKSELSADDKDYFTSKLPVIVSNLKNALDDVSKRFGYSHSRDAQEELKKLRRSPGPIDSLPNIMPGLWDIFAQVTNKELKSMGSTVKFEHKMPSDAKQQKLSEFLNLQITHVKAESYSIIEELKDFMMANLNTYDSYLSWSDPVFASDLYGVTDLPESHEAFVVRLKEQTLKRYGEMEAFWTLVQEAFTSLLTLQTSIEGNQNVMEMLKSCLTDAKAFDFDHGVERIKALVQQINSDAKFEESIQTCLKESAAIRVITCLNRLQTPLPELFKRTSGSAHEYVAEGSQALEVLKVKLELFKSNYKNREDMPQQAQTLQKEVEDLITNSSTNFEELTRKLVKYAEEIRDERARKLHAQAVNYLPPNCANKRSVLKMLSSLKKPLCEKITESLPIVENFEKIINAFLTQSKEFEEIKTLPDNFWSECREFIQMDKEFQVSLPLDSFKCLKDLPNALHNRNVDDGTFHPDSIKSFIDAAVESFHKNILAIKSDPANRQRVEVDAPSSQYNAMLAEVNKATADPWNSQKGSVEAEKNDPASRIKFLNRLKNHHIPFGLAYNRISSYYLSKKPCEELKDASLLVCKTLRVLSVEVDKTKLRENPFVDIAAELSPLLLKLQTASESINSNEALRNDLYMFEQQIVKNENNESCTFLEDVISTALSTSTVALKDLESRKSDFMKSQDAMLWFKETIEGRSESIKTGIRSNLKSSILKLMSKVDSFKGKLPNPLALPTTDFDETLKKYAARLESLSDMFNRDESILKVERSLSELELAIKREVEAFVDKSEAEKKKSKEEREAAERESRRKKDEEDRKAREEEERRRKEESDRANEEAERQKEIDEAERQRKAEEARRQAEEEQKKKDKDDEERKRKEDEEAQKQIDERKKAEEAENEKNRRKAEEAAREEAEREAKEREKQKSNSKDNTNNGSQQAEESSTTIEPPKDKNTLVIIIASSVGALLLVGLFAFCLYKKSQSKKVLLADQQVKDDALMQELLSRPSAVLPTPRGAPPPQYGGAFNAQSVAGPRFSAGRSSMASMSNVSSVNFLGRPTEGGAVGNQYAHSKELIGVESKLKPKKHLLK
eukprot:GDKJ01031993.1.p1 GENE.GDKJ01031993.1~~GDKJ01031993.1.p1  ORF type:complete len:1682 (-),score=510.30 GDKJ01031993.1:577-5499(-)